MSKHNSANKLNSYSSKLSNKNFSLLNKDEIKELFITNNLQELFYSISNYELNGLDLSLLNIEDMKSDLKMNNIHQRNELRKLIHKELFFQFKLNLIYEEKNYNIQCDKDQNFSIEQFIKFLKDSTKFNDNNICLSTNDGEILAPNLKINDLIIFYPDKYKTLHIINNFSDIGLCKKRIFPEKSYSPISNPQSNIITDNTYNQNNKENNYSNFQNNTNSSKRYESTNIDIGKYSSNIKDERPKSSYSNSNILDKYKEKDFVKDEFNNNISNPLIQKEININLLDSKEDDLIFSPIHSKNVQNQFSNYNKNKYSKLDEVNNADNFKYKRPHSQNYNVKPDTTNIDTDEYRENTRDQECEKIPTNTRNYHSNLNYNSGEYSKDFDKNDTNDSTKMNIINNQKPYNSGYSAYKKNEYLKDKSENNNIIYNQDITENNYENKYKYLENDKETRNSNYDSNNLSDKYSNNNDYLLNNNRSNNVTQDTNSYNQTNTYGKAPSSDDRINKYSFKSYDDVEDKGKNYDVMNLNSGQDKKYSTLTNNSQINVDKNNFRTKYKYSNEIDRNNNENSTKPSSLINDNRYNYQSYSNNTEKLKSETGKDEKFTRNSENVNKNIENFERKKDENLNSKRFSSEKRSFRYDNTKGKDNLSIRF